MSTPTPPEPQDRRAIPPVAPEGAAGTPGNPPSSPDRTDPISPTTGYPPPGTSPQSGTGATTGQHATDRPYPPSPARGTDDGMGATAATPVTGHPGHDDRHSGDDQRLAGERLRSDEHAAQESRLADQRAADESDYRGRHADGATPTGDRDDVRHEPLPEPPAKPGAGRHLLGTLLGLVLTPVALLLTGIGVARLADVVSAEEAATDPLGLTLLIVGVVLLAIIVLLGAWSPAVPITGGLVWGIGLGLAFLFIPGIMQDVLESMSADRVVPGGVEQLADTAMSGTLLVTGTLLLAAGVAAARARRRGRRWAEGVALAEAARRDARDTDRRPR